MEYLNENCCFCIREINLPVKITDQDNDNITYINKLKCVYQDLHIPDEKYLPMYICLSCKISLKQAFDFKQQCIRSFDYWSELHIPENNIKLENDPLFISIKSEVVSVQCDAFQSDNSLSLSDNYSDKADDFDMSSDVKIEETDHTNEQIQDKITLEPETIFLKNKTEETALGVLSVNYNENHFQLTSAVKMEENVINNQIQDNAQEDHKNRNITEHASSRLITLSKNCSENVFELSTDIKVEENDYTNEQIQDNTLKIHENTNKIASLVKLSENCTKNNLKLTNELKFAGTDHIIKQMQNKTQENHEDINETEQTASLIVMHHSIFSKDPLASCQICHETFSDETRLKTHMKFHSKDRKYECQFCHKKFLNSSALKSHTLTHTEERNFECDVCQKRFKSKPYLSEHMQKHTRAKEHGCDLCDRSFGSRSGLYFHKKTHLRAESTIKKKYYRVRTVSNNKDLPFPCSKCNKSFISKGRLNGHMKFHLNERNYKCEICNKTFVQSSGLNNHLNIHSEERKYECKFCQRKFKNRSSLTIHIDIHLDTVHKCPICNKIFQNLHTYYTHTRRVHRKNVQKAKKSPVLSKNLPPENNLPFYGPKLPFACEFCHKSFFTRTKHTKHKVIHDKKDFICYICTKTFNQAGALKAHMYVHSKEKTFECNICKKCFKTNVSMKIHKKKIHGREQNCKKDVEIVL